VLLLVGLNHRSAPLAVRERVAFEERDLPRVLAHLASAGGRREVLLLSTCNRVEILAEAEERASALEVIQSFLERERGLTSEEIARYTYHLEDKAAVRHLFHVASGLDSMILGEPQILGQVRRAYLAARTSGATGPVLDHLLQHGLAAAKRIRTETGLTASAGVAPNKFLAKIASGWKKPDGLTVISPDRVEPFLQKLPVDALWGVGPVTARKLRARGIERLVDVRAVEVELLRETVGSLADWLRQLANGVDDRPVVPNREAKSSGSENTYPEDLTDLEMIRAEIADMASHSIAWLTRRQCLARTVTIKVRYDDFTTITRSHTAAPTRDESDLTARAVRLLEKTDAGRRPVRLLGVSVHNFCSEEGETDPERLPFDEAGWNTEDTKDTK
jgi:nucleotidyltransferase/DNA polymerase involved in DNA repair